jgi:hypothetical protein
VDFTVFPFICLFAVVSVNRYLSKESITNLATTNNNNKSKQNDSHLPIAFSVERRE